MLLAFAATTVALRTSGGETAAPARVAASGAADQNVDDLEATLEDELQLRVEDPDFPGRQLTITTVRCSPPDGGTTDCAAGFVDQGGRPPLRVAVSFPAGRMRWRLVR